MTAFSLFSRVFFLYFFIFGKQTPRESVNFKLRTKRTLRITTLKLNCFSYIHTYSREREREPWKNSAAVTLGWTWEKGSSEAVEEERRWHWIAWRRRWACDSMEMKIFSGKWSRINFLFSREKRKVLVGKLVYLVGVVACFTFQTYWNKINKSINK